jgi:hypothetical protein
MDKPTPPENINIRGPGCCILLALALAGALLATGCALDASLETKTAEAAERYADLCGHYGGEIDADGWCRGARPTVLPARCLIEIAPGEGQPIYLDLTEGGEASEPIDIGDTSAVVRVMQPYGGRPATVSGRQEEGPPRPTPEDPPGTGPGTSDEEPSP